MDPYDTKDTLLRVMCVVWFIMRIRGKNMWLIENRTYPVIPVFEFFDGYPPVIQALLFYTSLLCMGILVVFPRRTEVSIILFIVALSSCILDVITWQPWEYQYIGMLAVFIINRNNPKAFYSCIILILASIYFYSGLQKFNGGFLHSIWEGLILKQFFGIPRIKVSLVFHYAGLALPIIEAAAGVGLLFSRSKRTAAFILISMHLFIVALLGTLQGYNIVIPWNIVMIGFLHFLFINKNTSFTFLAVIKKENLLIAILWGIMPAFSFIGYWDQKLSSNLFSGRYVTMVVCIKNEVDAKYFKNYIFNDDRYCVCKGVNMLSTGTWTRIDMHVLPSPANWYYQKVKKKFIKQHPEIKAEFFTYTYPFKQFKEVK